MVYYLESVFGKDRFQEIIVSVLYYRYRKVL